MTVADIRASDIKALEEAKFIPDERHYITARGVVVLSQAWHMRPAARTHLEYLIALALHAACDAAAENAT